MSSKVKIVIEIDDTRVSLHDLQLAVEYRPLRRVWSGLSANRLAIDVNAIDDDLRWNASYLYRGARFYIGLRWPGRGIQRTRSRLHRVGET